MKKSRKVNPLRKTAPGGFQFAVFAGRVSAGDSDAGDVYGWGIVSTSTGYSDIQDSWRYWSGRLSSQEAYRLGLVRVPGPHEIRIVAPALTAEYVRAAEARYHEWLRSTRPTPEEVSRDRRDADRADYDVL